MTPLKREEYTVPRRLWGTVRIGKQKASGIRRRIRNTLHRSCSSRPCQEWALGYNGEAEVTEIHADAANGFVEFLRHAVGNAADLFGNVIVICIIESHGQRRTTASAGSGKNADGFFGIGIAAEKGIQLLPGRIAERNHGKPPREI